MSWCRWLADTDSGFAPIHAVAFCMQSTVPHWIKLDTDAIAKEDQAQQRTKGYVPRAQQTTNVAADGTHDARFMTWYDLGTMRLTEGKNIIRFSLGGEQSDTKRFAAIDCFVLSSGTFQARTSSTNREKDPIVAPALKAEDSWAFAPKRDSFSAQALLDLRNLNESFAGEHGLSA